MHNSSDLRNLSTVPHLLKDRKQGRQTFRCMFWGDHSGYSSGEQTKGEGQAKSWGAIAVSR